MIAPGDVQHLVCPRCRGGLGFEGSVAARLDTGVLRCHDCGVAWPVEDGLPSLYDEDAVRGSDRFMRLLYDHLAPLHDPAVQYTLPLFQVGSAADMRAGYLARMALERLTPRSDGRPVRILDIGVGTGADLPLVRRRLPPSLSGGLPGAAAEAVEIWGLDLSRGMLRICRDRLRRAGDRETRLLLADAHALPFGDGVFDRVFHVGGIAGYREPARALAEMARVAVPGTPIVVVDEQLDRSRRQSLYHRLTFRLVTFYDPAPHCPVEHLPPGAVDVRAEQLNRFFYCLTFSMPGTGEITSAGGPASRARE
ncbi:MAG TPA: methyltransferase domain-containing protein [Polyangia bacterium]|jgi:SAM-dependent methyltransferase|nr:methyltransferase domain-containing protein [Polyangia bacterium]